MDTSGSMYPSEPMDGSREPIKRLLDVFENAKALIWQERQDRAYAGRILQGFYHGDLEPNPALYGWAMRVCRAHDLCNEEDQ